MLQTAGGDDCSWELRPARQLPRSGCTAGLERIKAWDDLTAEQKASRCARYGSAYAGMIDYMDAQIGRILDYLREIGEYDHTLVSYSSPTMVRAEPRYSTISPWVARPRSFLDNSTIVSTTRDAPLLHRHWTRLGLCRRHSVAPILKGYVGCTRRHSSTRYRS